MLFRSLSTIKSHIKWLTKYPTINTEHRLDTLGKKTIYDYQQFRLGKGASNQTLRNELSTINHFCKWAYKKGLHNTEKFEFPKISMRRTDKDEIRRATYTDAEYKRLHIALRSYTAKQLKENGFSSYEANEKLADMVLVELENKVLEEI